MESRVYAKYRTMELAVGGAIVIPAEGISDDTKAFTAPLGLSLWAKQATIQR